MALNVRSVEYFYIRIQNGPDSAYGLLAEMASEEINLLAFSAVPYGPNHVELTIFPERSESLVKLSEDRGWQMTGPQHAILVQGDDQLGSLAGIQRLLIEADVKIYASSGVTDGSGQFGYVIYFREADHRVAARVLGAVTRPASS